MNKSSVRHEPTRIFPVESNCLVVGGMSLTRLAERIGSTPFYAYDRCLITERVRRCRATRMARSIVKSLRTIWPACLQTRFNPSR